MWMLNYLVDLIKEPMSDLALGEVGIIVVGFLVIAIGGIEHEEIILSIVLGDRLHLEGVASNCSRLAAYFHSTRRP